MGTGLISEDSLQIVSRPHVSEKNEKKNPKITEDNIRLLKTFEDESKIRFLLHEDISEHINIFISKD